MVLDEVDVLAELLDALSFAFGMFWEILWALILGFALSGRTTVTWWTHKIRGLHRNDFIMAAKTDELYQR